MVVAIWRRKNERSMQCSLTINIFFSYFDIAFCDCVCERTRKSDVSNFIVLCEPSIRWYCVCMCVRCSQRNVIRYLMDTNCHRTQLPNHLHIVFGICKFASIICALCSQTAMPTIFFAYAYNKWLHVCIVHVISYSIRMEWYGTEEDEISWRKRHSQMYSNCEWMHNHLHIHCFDGKMIRWRSTI